MFMYSLHLFYNFSSSAQYPILFYGNLYGKESIMFIIIIIIVIIILLLCSSSIFLNFVLHKWYIYYYSFWKMSDKCRQETGFLISY